MTSRRPPGPPSSERGGGGVPAVTATGDLGARPGGSSANAPRPHAAAGQGLPYAACFSSCARGEPEGRGLPNLLGRGRFAPVSSEPKQNYGLAEPAGPPRRARPAAPLGEPASPLSPPAGSPHCARPAYKLDRQGVFGGDDLLGSPGGSVNGDVDKAGWFEAMDDLARGVAVQMEVIQPSRQDIVRNLSVGMWEASFGTDRLTDPVWGHLEFCAVDINESWRKNAAKQGRLSCLFSSFPCCLFTAAWCFRDRMRIKEGATHGDIRTGYQRMLLSYSFLLAIPQLLSVAFQQVVGYTWVAEDGVDFSGDYQHPTLAYQFDAEGAKNAAKIIYRSEWWRLVTPIFLHGGWLHLLGNLTVQLRTAMMLEAIWGRHVWLLIYLSSGIMGNVWSCIASPDRLSIGSSSSLSGIIGAWPVFIAITWNQATPNERKERDWMMVLVIVALVIMVALSFMPMVDWATHFGGLAAGMTVSATCFARKLQTPSWSIATGVVGALSCLSLFVGSMAYMIICVKPDRRLLDL